MTTWIVGDPHGCAQELSQLIGKLQLQEDDDLLVVGDLFHRGPDPAGVMDLLREVDAKFILGNHELRILQRFQLAPRRSDAADRPQRRTSFPELAEEDLAGDGRTPCHVPAERRAEVLEFLQGHAGFFLESNSLGSGRETKDGRPWCAVHAGMVQGRSPQDTDPEHLVSVRRLRTKGRPYWYEVYSGRSLVLFGHTPSKIPRARRVQGRLVALGLDTGCVYGGSLTAYSPEEDEFCQVAAEACYATR